MLKTVLISGVFVFLMGCVSTKNDTSNFESKTQSKTGSKVEYLQDEENSSSLNDAEFIVGSETVDQKGMIKTRPEFESENNYTEDNYRASEYTTEELYAFLTKQLSSTAIEPVTEQEASMIKSISQERYNVHGSIEEAVFALYILNYVITNVDFSEKTLYQTCIGYDFSIIKAISLNPMLKTYKVYNMVLMASQKSDLKEEKKFSSKLSGIVNKQVDLWTTLKQYDDSGLASGSVVMGGEENIAKEVISDTSSDEGILKTAQSYADSYQYKEAIGLLEKIESSSEQYNYAQQKIQDYSYLAVQDLRRKAATVFQNSISVSDPKVKAMYLEEAKKYLQIALKDYPHISEDQSSTVKENLQIIEDNLDKNED